MPDPKPSDAEKAMGANAESRVQQGVEDDEANRKSASEDQAVTNPPPSTDLTGPGGDPAEGPR